MEYINEARPMEGLVSDEETSQLFRGAVDKAKLLYDDVFVDSNYQLAIVKAVDGFGVNNSKYLIIYTSELDKKIHTLEVECIEFFFFGAIKDIKGRVHAFIKWVTLDISGGLKAGIIAHNGRVVVPEVYEEVMLGKVFHAKRLTYHVFYSYDGVARIKINGDITALNFYSSGEKEMITIISNKADSWTHEMKIFGIYNDKAYKIERGAFGRWKVFIDSMQRLTIKTSSYEKRFTFEQLKEYMEPI